MAQNRAAWLASEKCNPLEVKDAPYTPPKANEIVIRSRAVAMNPVDYFIQDGGDQVIPFKYPKVVGGDVAGEVFEVGSSVRNFKKGDRVAGFARALLELEAAPEGAFQEYVVVREYLASKIPDSVSFERAAVIPLCYTTAATALFMPDALGLEPPSLDPKPIGKTVLVWGGSTSVGCNAIQLAVAAGYEVITTASPQNSDYMKKLGASKVFDYKSSTVIDELVDALKGKNCVGALAIGMGSQQQCAFVISQTDGVKFVAAVSPPVPGDLPADVEVKFVLGSDNEDLGKLVYQNFLTQALAQGKFIPAPEPQVVGHGLESVQEALNVLKKGVSAKKVVVSL